VAKKKLAKTKKKKKKCDVSGIAFIYSTFNNTIITITNKDGDVVAWRSSGTAGFSGTKKGTPFAAQLAAEDVAKEVMDAGMKKMEVRVKGPGSGREASIRAIQAAGVEVTEIRDITPVPHNGCRPPKRRRV